MTAPFRLTDTANAEPLTGRGRRLPSTLDALDRRDELLVEAARRFFPDMSARQAAHFLRTALLRYQTGAWRRTCADLVCRHQAERLDALLWELLRARDYVPSERLIRAVLSRTASNSSME
jgi:hypothetical protein